MGLRNSIANCKNKINTAGSSRNVYYSKKYNLVFKRDRIENPQTTAEIVIFNKMTLEEKQIIPMVGVEYFSGKPTIIMEFVKILSTIKINNKPLEWHTVSCFQIGLLKEQMKVIIDLLELKDNINEFCALVRKYSLMDLSIENIGIYNGQLTIIDFGVNVNMY